MTVASNPPIEIPLERLTGPQHEEHSLDWHADVLDERLQREEQGKAVWRSLDETFDRIRVQIAHSDIGNRAVSQTLS